MNITSSAEFVFNFGHSLTHWSGQWFMVSEGDQNVAEKAEPLLKNDAVIFGILAVMLAVIFYTASLQNRFIKIFYKLVPMLLLCYFLPALLTTFNIVDPEQSQLYHVASRYLLPASLILLTLSIDFKEILRLGPKALIMFVTGTFGVIIGGPLAILITSIFAPEIVGGQGPEAIWRGFATVAGSWIGGGANQAAMFEVFRPNDLDEAGTAKYNAMYSVMVTVDVLVAEIWMLFLLLGVGFSKELDKYVFRADTRAIDELQHKMEKFARANERIPTTIDYMVLAGICFGLTAISHFFGSFLAETIGESFPYLTKFSLDSSFFWLIILATTFGLTLSFTSFRKYEGVGCSKIGTVFIFILVATIGLKMNLWEITKHPGLFMVGGIWMLIHVVLMIGMGILIRAPYFYLAVGSKANIGGAASAPVVAAAFHPSLAPVGVLLAVLGYALGTYGAYVCALMMQGVAPQ